MERQRRASRWVVFMLVGVWSGGAGVAARAQEPVAPAPANQPPARVEAKAIEADNPLVREIVAAHNQLRAAEKLPPLKFAPLLAQAAAVQAADMAEHGEMKHEGSDGSTSAERIKRTGYKAQASGENIAVFYPDVAQVMQAWVDSPPHRKNILGNFTELGIARVPDPDGKPYWCVDFGTPIPQFDPATATADFVAQLNEARTAATHPKLAVDSKLAAAAQAQAAESAKDRGKNGTPTTFAGFDASKYSELAMSTATGPPTAAAVLKMFLDNPGYKQRLFGPVTRIGVGYATDPDGTPYWCLILGKPMAR